MPFAPRLVDCLLIAGGSAVGGVARHLLAGWMQSRGGGKDVAAFPWGIFAVNVSGCFLLGLLMTVLAERRPDAWPGWRLLLGIGFLGGYTTFSTLLYDTWRLGPRIGFLNLAASAAAGWAATALASRLARFL